MGLGSNSDRRGARYVFTLGVVTATPIINSGSLIETRELTKRYGSQVLALDSLTVSIRGGVTGLVGANGAGKSTLIKILLGLLEPTDGEATLLGYDVRTHGTDLRQFVG